MTARKAGTLCSVPQLSSLQKQHLPLLLSDISSSVVALHLCRLQPPALLHVSGLASTAPVVGAQMHQGIFSSPGHPMLFQPLLQ